MVDTEKKATHTLTRVLKEVRGGNEFQSHQEVRIQITGYIESQVFDTFSVEEL